MKWTQECKIKAYQGTYLVVNPSSVRCRITESGTFLLSSLRISDKGLLMPELGTESSSFGVSGCEAVKAEERGFVEKRL